MFCQRPLKNMWTTLPLWQVMKVSSLSPLLCCVMFVILIRFVHGGHGTGKTGNLAIVFFRDSENTGKLPKKFKIIFYTRNLSLTWRKF